MERIMGRGDNSEERLRVNRGWESEHRLEE